MLICATSKSSVDCMSHAEVLLYNIATGFHDSEFIT